jgi:hypothetical protein
MLNANSAGRLRPVAILFSTSAVIGCGGGSAEGTGAAAVPQSGSPVQPVAVSPPARAATTFVDVTGPSNINFEFGFGPRALTTAAGNEGALARQILLASAGGAAAGDYDNDGDVDLFVVRGDRGPNLLYRNEGGLVFVDVAARAGLAYTKSVNENYAHSGPTFADMDGDGDLDLFLGGLLDDPSLVFNNAGDGTFTDVTAGSGIDTLRARNTVSAAFGDYDLDGDLDLFLAHWGTARDVVSPGDTEHLWRNDSAGGTIRFTSVSTAAAIAPSIITLKDPRAPGDGIDYTFTPTFARLNADLYPDILIAADSDTSMVFINDTDGTFTNITDVALMVDQYGMGSAVGDYDGDGDLDWFVTSIFGLNAGLANESAIGNRLYRNDGGNPPRFTDETSRLGVADGGWGWAACFLDLENDGDLDIYHTNGWPEWSVWGNFKADPSRAFLASGTGAFIEVAGEVGLNDRHDGRGVVCADFDDDGDPDILLLHRAPGVSATLWRNDGAGNTYLRVELQGKPPNTAAAGARVVARVGAKEQMREITIGSNYASQNPTTMIFGFGTGSSIDELSIEWPDGGTEVRRNVVANQTLEFRQP